MRFAVAAAVLAETLPVVALSNHHEFSHVISATTANQDASIHHFLASKKNAVRVNGQHPTGDKLKTMNRRRMLSTGDACLTECNPKEDAAAHGSAVVWIWTLLRGE